MHDGRSCLPARLRGALRNPDANRPVDLEVLEPPPAALRTCSEMAQDRLDDPRVEADREQNTVGDLAGELGGLWSGRRHQDGNPPPRGVRKAPRRLSERNG